MWSDESEDDQPEHLTQSRDEKKTPAMSSSAKKKALRKAEARKVKAKAAVREEEEEMVTDDEEEVGKASRMVKKNKARRKLNMSQETVNVPSSDSNDDDEDNEDEDEEADVEALPKPTKKEPQQGEAATCKVDKKKGVNKRPKLDLSGEVEDFSSKRSKKALKAHTYMAKENSCYVTVMTTPMKKGNSESYDLKVVAMHRVMEPEAFSFNTALDNAPALAKIFKEITEKYCKE